MAIPLGDIQFPNVQFDYAQLGAALQGFVNSGSQLGAIGIDQLTLISRHDLGGQGFTTVAQAIGEGTKLFDALAYFSVPGNQRPEIVHIPLNEGETDPGVGEISSAVFYVFIWTLIRGRAPSSAADADNGPIPNFLQNVMGLTNHAREYSAILASFDLARLNPSWVRHVELANMGQEAQNRLALGVAGYRVPAAIVYIPWHDNLPPNLLAAANAVKRFVRRGMTWDCFSGTRSGEFLDAVKNFNKNVENLLLDIADHDHIQYFVTHKMLAVNPTRREQYKQYQSWTHGTFQPFTDYIFGENPVEAEDPIHHHDLGIVMADTQEE